MTCIRKTSLLLLAGACALWAGGSITGTVKVKGDIPKDETRIVTKNAEQCGAKMNAQKYVISASGGVKWAVAMLEEAPKGGKAWGQVDLVYNNKECRFEPHVLIAPTGGTLKVSNSDDMLHNANFSQVEGDKKKGIVNLALPRKGLVLENNRILRRAGLISVECDAHDFMQGWIWSLPHPYASVTDSNGGFKIDDVPPGSYKLKVWHEGLGEKIVEVKVEDGQDSKVNVEL